MASNLSLLSEDQLLCSICLDLFTQPVTTPCGHNFCMSCLTSYWNSQAVCQCPICKETFENRPNLRVNTFISELMSQFTLLQVTDSQTCTLDQPKVNSDGVVLCDKMIEERQQRVKAMKESVEQSRKDSKDMIAYSVQELTALVSEIQENQEQLVRAIEEKQKEGEEEAEGLISFVNQEVNDSSFPVLQKNFEINTFSVSDNVTLRYLQQYEVNVVLDPNTANPHLILSNDMKQVRYNVGAGLWLVQDLKPNMFITHLAVLGHNGFMSRKFYFEVFVGQKTEWSLGVASGSIERRAAIPQSPDNGLWAIWFKKDRFETFCCPGVTVHSDTLERVGVFVDYDEGEVSFYDVEKAQLIFSFTECSFFEELYPYFNPCDNEYGANLDPLVIVPVGCSPDLQT
uniref:E3 ubiquitin-protein ligase TRIM21-like n=1 Tax=Cynoglossus semilaevis TaxID=244447 RepID=A0A3P8W1C0_CYNSE